MYISPRVTIEQLEEENNLLNASDIYKGELGSRIIEDAIEMCNPSDNPLPQMPFDIFEL